MDVCYCCHFVDCGYWLGFLMFSTYGVVWSDLCCSILNFAFIPRDSVIAYVWVDLDMNIANFTAADKR